MQNNSICLNCKKETSHHIEYKIDHGLSFCPPERSRTFIRAAAICDECGQEVWDEGVDDWNAEMISPDQYPELITATPKTFFTSDQHFDHRNVIKYDNRPYKSVEEMNSSLINRWNAMVSNKDIIWCLGDFSFANRYNKIESIVSQLHGHKKLILGNHDRLPFARYYDMGFEFVSPVPVILKHHFILSHAPIEGFDQDPNYFYIYGHVHNDDRYSTITKNSACVCCNRWGLAPTQLAAFDDYIDQQVHI